MTAELKSLKPSSVAALMREGRAVLIDVREPEEFIRGRAQGAVSRPLSRLDRVPIEAAPGQEVIFTCRTGMRTGRYCHELSASVNGPAYVLEGGLDAWTAAGLPVEQGRAQS